MGKEIERKFLLNKAVYRGLQGQFFKQGYLCSDKERTVRIRIIGDRGYLTVKSKVTGISRLEFEYEIPLFEAEEMLSLLCHKPIIEKHRYCIEYEGFVWEIDEFHDLNEGLVLAEVELPSETEEFVKPDWIGKEVTGIQRYYNSNLLKHPFRDWSEDEIGAKDTKD